MTTWKVKKDNSKILNTATSKMGLRAGVKIFYSPFIIQEGGK